MASTVTATVRYNDRAHAVTGVVGETFREILLRCRSLPGLADCSLFWNVNKNSVVRRLNFDDAVEARHNNADLTLRPRAGPAAAPPPAPPPQRAPPPAPPPQRAPPARAPPPSGEVAVSVRIGDRSFRDWRVSRAAFVGSIPGAVCIAGHLPYSPSFGVVAIGHDRSETELRDMVRVSDIAWDGVSELLIREVSVVNVRVTFPGIRKTNFFLKTNMLISEIPLFIHRICTKWAKAGKFLAYDVLLEGRVLTDTASVDEVHIPEGSMLVIQERSGTIAAHPKPQSAPAPKAHNFPMFCYLNEIAEAEPIIIDARATTPISTIRAAFLQKAKITTPVFQYQAIWMRKPGDEIKLRPNDVASKIVNKLLVFRELSAPNGVTVVVQAEGRARAELDLEYGMRISEVVGLYDRALRMPMDIIVSPTNRPLSPDAFIEDCHLEDKVLLILRTCEVQVRVFLRTVDAPPVIQTFPGTDPLSSILSTLRMEGTFSFYLIGERQTLTPLDSTAPFSAAGRDAQILIKEIVAKTHDAQLKFKCNSSEDKERCRRLIRVIRKAQCPFVMKLMSVSEKRSRNAMVLTMSIQATTELPLDGPVNPHIVLCGVAQAFIHLCEHRIVFRTLSRRDVCLNGDGLPVLTGFVNAFFLHETMAPVRPGDELYCAPEVGGSDEVGHDADIWSFGLLMWELVMKRRVTADFVRRLQAGEPVDFGRSPYAELIAQCLAVDHWDRPSFRDIFCLLIGQKFADLITRPVFEYLTRFLQEPDLRRVPRAVEPEPAPRPAPMPPPPPAPAPAPAVGPLARFSLDDYDEEERYTDGTGRATAPDGSTVVIKQLFAFAETLDEYERLESHTCPSVVNYKGISLVCQDDEDYFVSLLRDFCENGTLNSHIGSLSAAEKHTIAFGLAKGIQFLHARGIVHGELNPSNVLLNGRKEPVIIGFPLTESERNERNPEDVNKPADIWAYGNLLWKILIGRDPDPDCDQLPRSSYRLLLEECLLSDPQERIKAIDIGDRLKSYAFKSDVGIAQIPAFREYVLSFQETLDSKW
jgi:serine/threonine protein kinase